MKIEFLIPIIMLLIIAILFVIVWCTKILPNLPKLP